MGERTNDFEYPSKRTAENARKDSIISRDSGYELEKSNNLEKSDLNEKIAAERLKKTEESIKIAYEIIIDDRKKNISTRIIIFTVITILLLLGVLLAGALIKLSNQNTSLNIININKSFNTFLLTVSREIYAMKMLNFHEYSNNTNLGTIFYGVAAGYVNITTAMDKLVINFDISSITQTWSTLSCNSTGGNFALGAENNFLTVSDFIQNPVTNLLASPATAFKFPPNLSGQTKPLGANQCLYFTLVLNALYITIPGFLNLKNSIMDNILVKNVSVSLPMMLLFVAVVLISILYVLGKVIFNMRITRLKNYTYDLFESLERDLIQ
jgi:hypothetical protein